MLSPLVFYSTRISIPSPILLSPKSGTRSAGRGLEKTPSSEVASQLTHQSVNQSISQSVIQLGPVRDQDHFAPDLAEGVGLPASEIQVLLAVVLLNTAVRILSCCCCR
jgi:hypothetical protein